MDTKVTKGLTESGRKWVREYLADWCRDGVNVDVMLSEIEHGGNHGVDPEIGMSFEIAGRYSRTGNPIPFEIGPDDFVWTDADD